MNWRIAIPGILLASEMLAGGCARSSKTQQVPSSASKITNVAQSSATPPRALGEQSCASSGCHGAAFDGTARDWHSAFAVWNQEDPHRHAFAVLYTQRSVEMYRNLHPESKPSAELPSDAEYAAFVSQRCLGCHATGLRGRDVVALGDARDVPEYYLAGVTCESCHGPASGWLHTHYLAGFSRSSPGFSDTKNPQTLADRCVGCHIGPMVAENGRAYDMNHDLIAAGHPRLSFEVSTYLANYPKHWPADDRLAHIAVWAAGQEQAARQLTRQVVHRLTQAKRSPNDAPWPDFSNFDCFDCHHTLRAVDAPRPREAWAGGRTGVPRPALLALQGLRRLAGDEPQLESELAIVQQVLATSWKTPVENIVLPTEYDLSLLIADEGEPLVTRLPPPEARRRHVAMLQGALAPQQSPDASSWTWDEAAQFHLAVSALVRDLGPDGEELRMANQSLAVVLAQQSFSVEQPRQYDSPTTFDSSRLQPPLRQIERALSRL
jgi:hypothetical protein